MDVVPAGEGWQVPPFSGEVRDGILWGRGALDTKGLGIAHLAAIVDLKRRGVPLARDVVFLALADEERGGGEGMAWIARAHPELVTDTWALFNEGGGARVTSERVLWWEVEVAQKRPLWLKVTTRGRGGHGSAYNPESATHQLVQGLARLVELPAVYRVSPVVERYFRAIAPLHKNPRLAQSLARISQIITPTGPSGAVLPPGLERLFLDTMQITVLNGSSSINVIPTDASALIDVRLLPDTDQERYLTRVRETLGSDFEVEVLVQAPESAPSPIEHPAFRTLEAVLGKWAPVVPSLLAGFTDSRFFRERGIPAYGVSPFAIEPSMATGVHGVDERISLATFDEGVSRMKSLVEACVKR